MVGGKDGESTVSTGDADWLSPDALLCKGQAPVADSSDAAAPRLSEWKVDSGTGVAS